MGTVERDLPENGRLAQTVTFAHSNRNTAFSVYSVSSVVNPMPRLPNHGRHRKHGSIANLRALWLFFSGGDGGIIARLGNGDE